MGLLSQEQYHLRIQNKNLSTSFPDLQLFPMQTLLKLTFLSYLFLPSLARGVSICSLAEVIPSIFENFVQLKVLTTSPPISLHLKPMLSTTNNVQ